MTDPALRPRMPGRLIGALVFVVLQVAFNAFFGVLMGVEIDNEIDHGQDVDGLLYLVQYASYAFSVLLLISAIAVLLGYDWGRWPLIVVEAVALLNGVITLFSGAPAALAGLVLAVLVITTMFNDTVRSWFDAKAYQRHQA